MAEEKVIRLNLNRGADRYERNKELADYVVNEGLVPPSPRGNPRALSTGAWKWGRKCYINMP